MVDKLLLKNYQKRPGMTEIFAMQIMLDKMNALGYSPNNLGSEDIKRPIKAAASAPKKVAQIDLGKKDSPPTARESAGRKPPVPTA